MDEKALELGRLLGQSDEYRALVRATDRMKEDAQCQQLLSDVERLAQEIERSAQAGREPSKEAITAFLGDKIAKWQLPDDVVFVPEIPHGATGKVLKTKLREQFRDYRLPTA